MKLPIGIRLAAGFLAMIGSISVIVLVGLRPLSELRSVSEEMTEHHIPEVHLLWKIRTLLTEIYSKVQHPRFRRADGELLLRLREDLDSIRRSIESYRNLQGRHSGPLREEAHLLQEFTTSHRSFEEATERVMDLLRRGGREDAATLVAGPWTGAYRATLQGLDRLLDFEDQETMRLTVLARDRSLQGRNRILLLAAASILLSVALAVAITLSLTRPIRRLVEVTEHVAEGKLKSRAEVGREDEVGLLARRFNEMMDRLDRSFENQRAFFADVSHQLRTPLTIIRGEAEVALRSSGPAGGEHREPLETIVAAAGQMGQLVDDLLFLARSESGYLRYRMERIDLGPLLEEVARQSAALGTSKQLQLELDAKQALAVWGDAERLRQLFLALVDNAIKHSKPGGKIGISARVEGERARVEVSDTGTGIPAEDLPHVFERFYRVDRRASGAGPGDTGTGLGLSIAQSIARAHQTEIEVESAVGLGTIFTIRLPRAWQQG